MMELINGKVQVCRKSVAPIRISEHNSDAKQPQAYFWYVKAYPGTYEDTTDSEQRSLLHALCKLRVHSVIPQHLQAHHHQPAVHTQGEAWLAGIRPQGSTLLKINIAKQGCKLVKLFKRSAEIHLPVLDSVV